MKQAVETALAQLEQACLENIGKYALLTKDAEATLAKDIEAGRQARGELAGTESLTPSRRRELRRLPARAAPCPALQVLDTGGQLHLLIHPPQAATCRLAQPVVFFAFAEQVLQAGALALRRGTPRAPHGPPRRVASSRRGQPGFPLPLLLGSSGPPFPGWLGFQGFVLQRHQRLHAARQHRGQKVAIAVAQVRRQFPGQLRQLVQQRQRRFPLGGPRRLGGHRPVDHSAAHVRQVVAQVTQLRFLSVALAVEPRLGVGGRAMGGVAEVLPVPLRIAAAVRAVGPTAVFHPQRGRCRSRDGRRHGLRQRRRWLLTAVFSAFDALDHRQLRSKRFQRSDGRVGFNLGAVDPQALAGTRAGDAGGFAEPDRLGQQLLPHAALLPLLGAQLHQRRLVGNRVGKGEATEPAKAGMHGEFVAELPLREAVEMLEDPHADHQFRIDRGAAKLGVERGDLLPDEAQIKGGVQSPQGVVGWHQSFDADADDLIGVQRLLTEHPGSPAGRDETRASRFAGVLALPSFALAPFSSRF